MDLKTYFSNKLLHRLIKILHTNNRPLQSLPGSAVVSDPLPRRIIPYPSQDIQLSFLYSWNSKSIRNSMITLPSGKNLEVEMNKWTIGKDEF